MKTAIRPVENPSPYGFTLIELMTVIAIFGILMAIALPRFQEIGRRSALDAATASVVSALNFTRQHALTHRQPTYLIIPGDESGDTTNAYRRFAIYSIQLPNAANGDQATGEFITPWNDLPAGIVFDNADPNPANILTPAPTPFTGGFDDHSRIKIDGATNYYACGFTPTGQRTAPNAFLYLAEGIYPDGQRFIPTTVTSNEYNSIMIHIFSSGTINTAPEKATIPTP